MKLDKEIGGEFGAVTINRDWVLSRLVENVERAMQTRAVLDNDGKPTGEYCYNGPVALRGLELIGKHLGMFKERVELSRRNPLENIPPERLKDLHRELYEKLKKEFGGEDNNRAGFEIQG